jgi:hypothetical protein
MCRVPVTTPPDASGTASRQPKATEERRRQGRIDRISPALTALLRNPENSVVAGDPDPADKFQIAAGRAASAYTPIVWLTILSPSEQAAAIYREMRKLDEEA